MMSTHVVGPSNQMFARDEWHSHRREIENWDRSVECPEMWSYLLLSLAWPLLLAQAGPNCSIIFPSDSKQSVLSDVNDVVSCYVRYLPRAGSTRFPIGEAIPSEHIRLTWRIYLESLLRAIPRSDPISACSKITPISKILSDWVTVRDLTEVNRTARHCLLHPASISKEGLWHPPWGMVVIARQPKTPVYLFVSHPVTDDNTAAQGAAVYKGLDASLLMIAGTTRDAFAPMQTPASGTLACPNSLSLDAAHQPRLLFQAALEAVMHVRSGYFSQNLLLQNVASSQMHSETQLDEYVVVEFHAMAQTSCKDVDIFLSSGIVEDNDRHKDRVLENALKAVNQTLRIAWPSKGTRLCHLAGTTNIQGRLLNGVPGGEVCHRSASSASNRFLHIEQKIWPRSQDAHSMWVSALLAVLNREHV